MEWHDSVTSLHQLAYAPGQWMGLDWWRHLGLQGWQRSYQDYPHYRRELDSLIRLRRGFPEHGLVIPDDEFETELLQDFRRLPVLLTALGLIRIAKFDYFLLGNYRKPLISCLGEEVFWQLHGIFPQEQQIDQGIQVAIEPISETKLPELAFYLGWAGLYRNTTVWRALSILFPADFVTTPIDNQSHRQLIQWWKRIRRFL
ncbi:type III secretion system domain-containing protein [Dongshaea marina]|uniref:type III secretion system domain-containing protein n=1 Tax=Dongshaea marina TaxID=2047966 RepID=UPI000D3E0856|nr:type III secretion system domain-containing protein [Dongshaea marina]